MFMDEPTPTNPTLVRPRLRAAIRRAIARRDQDAAPALDLPADAAPPASAPQPALPQRQDQFRQAANRAAARQRQDASPGRVREPVAADSFGRMRTRARPRTRDHEMAIGPVDAEALQLAVAALPAPAPGATTARPRQRATPAAVELLQPELAPPAELRRPPLWLAALVGIGWAGMLVWLMLGSLGPQTAQTPRLLFGLALSGLGVLTWGPLQWATRLPVLTWRGTVGWGIVLWVLAFVPPPTQPLVAGLPDIPVYLLFFGGLFLASNAVALPLVYLWGVRRYHNRAERFDVSRSRRQAAECGLFVALCAVFAVMNILEIVTVILLIAILALSEMVMLSLKK
jgi:hypothetical protein